ncbi:MAG: Nre family DNA repair protein [Nitrososphaerota archaeon]|nr:Nre family DNA repair protein [Nitrososphaerales archaeon]MDW8045398.1 Nre family DNA repair protein [Nitrososphaerota archaeon]
MSKGTVKWLSDLISVEGLGELVGSIEIVSKSSTNLCLLCKGGRMLCGKVRCPIIVKAQSMIKYEPLLNDHIHGSTPPSVFVGRIGYPKVYIGPMIPPYFGSTEILDTPEDWIGKSIYDIIDYRFSLIRGKVRMSIFNAQRGDRLLETLQELAMGERSIDAEAVFMKRPRKVLSLSEETQPFGPSAPLKSLSVGNVSVDRRIEEAFYDRDLKAADAIYKLYDEGVLVTRIQRAFSIGMLGIGARRKLVPTRWSITAVDSIISLKLIDEIKQYNSIDEYRVYSFKNLDNIFIVILMPGNWSFEWIEAWFPGTTWNVGGKEPALMGDYEGYWGRTTYASVGGCYYAARLAVAERLRMERKQASALLLREIHPGYILPVGVWNVRESVRSALRNAPATFDDLNEAWRYACTKLTIPPEDWIANSSILKRAFFQRKITDYFDRSELS